MAWWRARPLAQAIARCGSPLGLASLAAAGLSSPLAQAEPSSDEKRFQQLPPQAQKQQFAPHAPYPAWDSNWDYRDLSLKQIADHLGHSWPIRDFAQATRQLLSDHTAKTSAQIDKIVEEGASDPPALYRKAYRRYAFGGAPVRHIILVRHGQYEERKDISSQFRSADRVRWMDECTFRRGELWDYFNSQQVLTPLGRHQAEKTGDRLAQMLQPVLTGAGREEDVCIRVSTMTRAIETADIIASRLPKHVHRTAPDPSLEEGGSAHSLPTPFADGDDVYYDGSRLETAFRHLFYRGLPSKQVVLENGKAMPIEQASSRKRSQRNQYDIVVCHMNVIRFFLLRGLQLPPEAWLRLGGFNCSITYMRILPDGSVKCDAFGDAGHLDLDETTFGTRMGWERS